MGDKGGRDEHCFNDDHTRANACSRPRYAPLTFPRSCANSTRPEISAGIPFDGASA